ncbi:MAG: dsDNA nuclease domain-containing protein [Burkholderiales bacterium]
MNSPLDAGTTTLQRYRYQAEVTLPFCLSCALGGDIIAVIPEHFEDIALECGSPWRFIQVKSRDPERPMWGLTDLLSRQGGALRSLLRTHKLTPLLDAKLELILEGATKRGDLIDHLKDNGDRGNQALVAQVATSCGLAAEDAREFLARVSLLAAPSPRPNIRDSNLRLLHEQNPSLNHETVVTIYERLIGEIERAMRAQPLGPQWPRYVARLTKPGGEKAALLEAKRLSRESLRKIIEPIITPPLPLLRQLTDSTSNAKSTLEQKLLAGGADSEMIHSARTLRANAQVRWFQVQAASLYPRTDALSDLNLRLQSLFLGLRAMHANDPRPAVAIWNDVLNRLTANPDMYDRAGLMGGDAFLLLGHICQLAELCRVDWGIANGTR